MIFSVKVITCTTVEANKRQVNASMTLELATERKDGRQNLSEEPFSWNKKEKNITDFV